MIISEYVLHYILTPKLRNMSLHQKLMYGYEFLIHKNRMHVYLIYGKKTQLKLLDPDYSGCPRLRSVENHVKIFSPHRNEVMKYDKFFMRRQGMLYITEIVHFPFSIST